MGVASTVCFTFPFTSTTVTRSVLRRQLHSLLAPSSSFHNYSSINNNLSRSRLKRANSDCKASVHVQSKWGSNPQRSLVKITARRIFARRISCSLLGVEDDLNDDESCELVSGAEVSIGEGDDSISAYLLRAVKNNNGIGILLLSDIYGFEGSSTRDFAYRVACSGFNVLVPDIFRGEPWTRDRPMTLFDEWMAKQEPRRVAKDIDTSVGWMADEFMAAGISKKLGIIGFCFGGGRVIEVLSRDQGARFGVGVSFYGTKMDPSIASHVKVPVLLISGDSDPLCEVRVLHEIEKSIGNGSRVVIFKGRGHGFAHRPISPEEDTDAEQAFSITRSWLLDDLDSKN